MDIEFSIKSKKFYKFICVFNSKDAEVNRKIICGTEYIKVYISYELDDNKKVLQKDFRISKDTEEKNVPRFINLPIEIQKMMVEKSSSKSCIPFLHDIRVSRNLGGFDWDDTEEKYFFWNAIINRNDFDTFFMRYPSYLSTSQTDLRANTSIPEDVLITCDFAASCGVDITNELLDKVNQLTETLTKKERENEKNQLQRKEVSQRREYTGTSRVLRGANEIRITVGHLGYQKIIVRG